MGKRQIIGLAVLLVVLLAITGVLTADRSCSASKSKAGVCPAGADNKAACSAAKADCKPEDCPKAAAGPCCKLSDSCAKTDCPKQACSLEKCPKTEQNRAKSCTAVQDCAKTLQKSCPTDTKGAPKGCEKAVKPCDQPTEN